MSFPTVNYKEPETASDSSISLEVLKSGMILNKLEFKTSAILFGRLPNCDVVLDHPSSSRYHCMMQHMDNNWFLYDLESAHGTFLNKKRIEAKSYVPLYNGDMVKFGASSRLFIIHGAKERVLLEKKVEQSTKVSIHEFMEDIQDDTHMKLTGKSIPVAVYSKDPKGVLSTWFDQQGYDLNIEFSQVVIQGDQGFIATLQMPVELISFVAQGKGAKKKEAEIDVCLVACRKLDERGLLVDTEAVLTEAEKRKIRNQMFGDSDNDDDLVYDRTVKKKKESSKSKKPETFESLTLKRQALLNELDSITNALNISNAVDSTVNEEEEDSLDAFMTNIKSETDKNSVQAYKKRLPELNLELEKLEKLIEIVRPSSLIKKDLNIVEKSKDIFKMPQPRQSPKKKQEPPAKPESESNLDAPESKPEVVEKKPPRQYRAMTMDESVKHYSVETEDVESAPDLPNEGKSNVSDMNAAYGY